MIHTGRHQWCTAHRTGDVWLAIELQVVLLPLPRDTRSFHDAGNASSSTRAVQGSELRTVPEAVASQ